MRTLRRGIEQPHSLGVTAGLGQLGDRVSRGIPRMVFPVEVAHEAPPAPEEVGRVDAVVVEARAVGSRQLAGLS